MLSLRGTLVLGALIVSMAMSQAASAIVQPMWKEELPLASYGHLGVWDPVRNRLLVFGREGEVDDATEVWSFDPSGSVWSRLITTGTPAPLFSLSAVLYDSRRDRVLLIRSGDYSHVPGIWALDLSGTPAWSEVHGGETLSYLWGTAYCYDSRRDRIVAFGSNTGTYSSYGNTVYELDLSDPAPVLRVLPAGTPPNGRAYVTAVYDSSRDRMLVFGGRGQTPGYPYSTFELDETWELQFSPTPTWRFLTPLSSVPPPRSGHAVALDTARERMFMFGGYGRDDVWSLDLREMSGANWILRPSLEGPRSGAIAAYDGSHDQMLFHGGTSGQYPPDSHNEVWSLRLNRNPPWLDLTAGSRPPLSGQAVYDSVGDRLLMLGSSRTPYQYDEVWSLANGQWTQITKPFAMRGSLALDPGGNRVFAFGGLEGGVFHNDVRALDLATATWSSVPGSFIPPAARSESSVFYDRAGDRLIVFGGYSGDGVRYVRYNDTWALPLYGLRNWSRLIPAGTPPAPRSGAVVVHDARRNRVLFAGGVDSNGTSLRDVWALTLDQAPAWKPLVSTGDGVNYFIAAAVDPVEDRMVVVDLSSRNGWQIPRMKSAVLGDTLAWEVLAAQGREPHRIFPYSCAYDTRRQAMLIAGRKENDLAIEVYSFYLDYSTPVVASLLEVDATPDRVVLRWHALTTAPAAVERSGAGADWILLGYAKRTGERLEFEDPNVVAGSRYVYRLVFEEGANRRVASETEVWVPRASSLTFAGALPNPSRVGIAVEFTLPAAASIEIEVVDVAGRSVERMSSKFAAGRHRVPMVSGASLPPGVYLVRANLGGATFRSKALVVR